MEVEFLGSINDLAFIQELCKELRKSGLKVSTYSFLSYEKFVKINKRRSMFARVCIHLMFSAITIMRMAINNRIFVLSTNSILPSFLAAIFYSHRTIIWVYDIYPDAARISGKVSENSCFSNMLDWMFSIILRRAETCVFLGDKLKIHAENKYAKCKKSVSIPLGANISNNLCIKPKENENKMLHLLYIGNFGMMHDISTLENYLYEIHSGKRMLEKKLFIEIAGYGTHRKRIEYISKLLCKNEKIIFKFEGYLSEMELIKRMYQANIALVTLKKGAEKVCLPSKVYTAVALNTPILAICPPISDLANFVNTNGFGWVVENNDTDRLDEILQMLISDSELLINTSKLIENEAAKLIGFRLIAKKWLKIFRVS